MDAQALIGLIGGLLAVGLWLYGRGANPPRRALAQLVSPAVLAEMRRRRYALQPGGERRDITAMFVDIRHFTLLAENLAPPDVTELLNDFYAAVVAVVFRHQGTVDKFMGDGILVLFGAPAAMADHGDRALAAAREVLTVTEDLARRWWVEKSLPVKMGVSLNSGAAFVGFFGPAYKLEYTAIGDAVNICVHLQTQNKRFNTRLILTEATLERLSRPPEDLIALGSVSVKGREANLQIATLSEALGDSPSREEEPPP